MGQAADVAVRLRADGFDLPDDDLPESTHAGFWQRREGAWSWILISAHVGSYDSMTALLRCANWRYDSVQNGITVLLCEACMIHGAGHCRGRPARKTGRRTRTVRTSPEESQRHVDSLRRQYGIDRDD